jgi:uncharacterized protein YbbK (DUF523 family)
MSRPPAEGSRNQPADVIRVGISRCLLGDEVRYDGQHKRSAFAVDVLGPQVEFVAVCPEVELGMPIPREPVRLETGSVGPRMIAPGSGKDWTDEMHAFVSQRVKELAELGLSGFILQHKSPSCGVERVKLFDSTGAYQRISRGLFAAELMRQYPLLPVVEERQLHDPQQRDHFLRRLFGASR